MKKFLQTTILSTLAAISIFNFSFAQTTDACGGDSIFPPLVICGRSSTSACEQFKEPCEVRHLPLLMGEIIIFIITLLLILSPIYIMYIGIQMIFQQGLPKQLNKLKGQLLWTIVYLIIILGSWLIIKEVVNVFGISSDVPSFLLDNNGQTIQNPGNSIH
jgi:hypothetical protein